MTRHAAPQTLLHVADAIDAKADELRAGDRYNAEACRVLEEVARELRARAEREAEGAGG